MSKSYTTITDYTIIISILGGEGIGHTVDSISCSDTSAIINNIIADARLENTGNDSGLHCYTWIVKAAIDSTISVTAQKSNFCSTQKLYFIKI